MAQKLSFPTDLTLIVWLNEHFGQIQQDGKSFFEMEVYERHRDRIYAAITMQQRTPATFGPDVAEVMRRRFTFKEALASPDFQTMARSRLKIIRGDVFAQLAAIY